MMSSQNKTPSTSTTTSSSSSRLRASSTKSMMVMMKESPKRSTSAPTPTPKPVATTLNDNISTKPRRPKSGELVPDANNKKKNKYNNNNNNSKQVLLHEIKVENGIDKDLMIKDLEDQVVKLKLNELDKALAFNSDIQLQNHKLSQELAAAHSKIATLSPQRIRWRTSESQIQRHSKTHRQQARALGG
ncbi:hypothetical protein TIFTF001_041140 [Ficus carica]|uniref:Uncharacterized protein n=1 Tax=Ficus carica TaxID=3494 RepID=A0AA87ZB80_FICCA|nr:hypothetical protein TIFTF001_041140 [Ficus carica]